MATTRNQHTMKDSMEYVIGYHRGGRIRFVRVYKNGSQWVERLHAKTATKYSTQEVALVAAKQLNIVNPDIRTI